MGYYYLIVSKESLNMGSANLKSDMYVETNENDTRLAKFRLHLFSTLRNFDPDKEVLLKVEVSDSALRQTTTKTESNGKDVTLFPGHQDNKLLAKSIDLAKIACPIKIVAQIMPDNTERTKKDAMKEEGKRGKINKDTQSSTIKSQKDHTVLRAFTYLAQKVIDVKERNIGKDESPHSSKRI